MEERNILWGELVGGLLVVGCSAALIISLWATFRDNPIFKGLTFTGAAAAVLGAGLYTQRRWRLESTSRGLLVLGLLLVPLALLGLTLPGARAPGWLDIAVQAVSLLALLPLAAGAARVLAPDLPWRLAGALIALAACQVPSSRQVHASLSETHFIPWAMLPVACFGVCLATCLVGRRGRVMDGGEPIGLFVALGAATFALLLALGQALYLSGDIAQSLGWLAMPIAFAGVPIVAVGTAIHHGLASQRRWAGRRTAATAVALAGMTVMLLAAALAWPRPGPFLTVCLLDGAVFTLAAFGLRAPLAHLLALPCLTAAAVLGWFLVFEQIELTAEATGLLALMMRPQTGTILLVLLVAYAIAAEVLARRGREAHAVFYAAGGLAAGLVAVVLASWDGLDAPRRASLTSAIAGAGALALGARWRRGEAIWLGLLLLVAASQWELWRAWGQLTPASGTVLAGEALLLGITALFHTRALRRTGADGESPLFPGGDDPLVGTSLLVSVASVVVAALTARSAIALGQSSWQIASAGTAACLALLASLRGAAYGRLADARIGAILGTVALLLLTGWVFPSAGEMFPVVPLGIAAAGWGLVLLLVSVLIQRRGVDRHGVRVLAQAWDEAATASVVLAIVFVVTAPREPGQFVTLAFASAVAFLGAWANVSSGRAWAGSALLLVAIAHFLLWGLGPHAPGHPLLFAALVHATVIVLVGLALGCSRPTPARNILANALVHSGALSSSLAAALVSVQVGQRHDLLAVGALWLGTLWLLLALGGWGPLFFDGFQGALGVAATFGLAAWKEHNSAAALTYAVLPEYGLALASLCLVWGALRRWALPSGRLGTLPRPPWAALDRIVLAALVVGAAGLAFAGVAPGVVRELAQDDLSSALPVQMADMAGPATGWLLALLALVLVVEARESKNGWDLVGLLLLALVVPVLASVHASAANAVASAVRWGVGIAFLLLSLPVWMRHRLSHWSQWLGVGADESELVAARCRALLVSAAALPVVAITVTSAVLRWEHLAGPGPTSESFFGQIGRLYNTVVPLVMVCVGLVTHALRERLPGYAFVVGLGANLVATLTVRSHHAGAAWQTWWLPLVQANVIALAATALVWLAARRRLYGETGTGPLLTVQVGASVVAATLLLAWPVTWLISSPGSLPAYLAHVGSGVGWLGTELAFAALLWWVAVCRREGMPSAIALTMAVGAAILACSFGGHPADSWTPYYVLVAGWAGAAASMLIAGRLASRKRAWALWPAAGYLPPVAALAALVLFLGLRAMPDDFSAGRPAIAIAFAALVYVLLAIGQGRQEPAFAAALLIELTVGFLVWHLQGRRPLADVLLPVGTGALVAAAATGLVWLGLHRKLFRDQRLPPLLAVQLLLPALGWIALLAGPVRLLLAQPGDLPQAVARTGHWSAWIGLVLTLAGLWAWGGPRTHLLGGAGMAAGALAACTAARWDGGTWLAYHVLTASFAAVALGALLSGRASQDGEQARSPGGAQLAWVLIAGAAVLALAVRGTREDPSAPYPVAAAFLFVAALATDLALGRREEAWAFVACLPWCLAVSVVFFFRHQPWDWALDGRPLARIDLMAGGLAALVWLAGARKIYGVVPLTLRRSPWLTAWLVLLVAGTLALLAGPLYDLIVRPGDLNAAVAAEGEAWTWYALAATVVPMLWYVYRTLCSWVGIAAVAAGLAIVVVLAFCTGRYDRHDWLAYHVLVAWWGIVGATALAAAWARHRRGLLGPGARGRLVGAVTLVGALLIVLAVRATEADPARPWWPAGVVIAVSLGALALAVWLCGEGWAFLAALGLELAAIVMSAARHEGQPLAEWWVPLLQSAATAGALAALAWMGLRRPIYVTRRPSLLAAPLLLVQTALPVVANVVLLVTPLVLLLAHPEALPEALAPAGGWGGWLALGLALATVVCHTGRRLVSGAPHLVAGLGLSIGVLVACTASRWDRGNWLAYHVLLGAWALTGAWVLVRGWLALRARAEDGARLQQVRHVAAVVGVVDALVVALAVRGAVDDAGGMGWSIGAVLLVAAEAAALAVWRRSETWAFVATACFDLAVSLFVWDVYRGQGAESWWIELLQANVLSGSVAALLWLVINRRAYAERPAGIAAAPLLSIQTFVALAGNAVLLVNPALFNLVWYPQDVPAAVADADGLGGWLTLGATAVVAVVQLRVTRMHGGIQVLGSLGLAAGLLAACTAARWDQHDFLAYHVLMAGWALLAACMLLGGWLDVRWRVLARALERDPRSPVLSRDLVREWVSLAGLPVLALAVRGVLIDPTGAGWSVGSILAVSVLVALVGIDQGRERWVFAAGLGVNLALSLLLWREHLGQPLAQWWLPLVQGNVVASAVAALVWLLAGRRGRGLEATSGWTSRLRTAQVLLPLLGNLAMLAWPAWHLSARPGTAVPMLLEIAGTWGWLALGTASLAAAIHAGRTRRGLEIVTLAALLAAITVAGATARLDPSDAWLPYHVLMSGWATVGLALAAILALGARLPSFVTQVAVTVSLGLGPVLAVRGVESDPAGPWWCAGVVLAASAAASLLALALRRDAWGFVAGLCSNGAVSLALWRLHMAEPLAAWWPLLVQANAITCAVAALVWLAGVRAVEGREGATGARPLRGLQSLLALIGCGAMLFAAVGLLMEQPEAPPVAVSQAGGVAGWLALAFALLAGMWHFRRHGATAKFHLAGFALLCLAAMGACTAASGGPWIGHRVLMLDVTGAAVLLLVAGWAWHRRQARADVPQPTFAAVDAVDRWVVLLGLITVALAGQAAVLHPGDGRWPALVLFVLAGVATGLAAARRKELWAAAACVLVESATALVVWDAHRSVPCSEWTIRLAQAVLLAAALAGTAWAVAAWRWSFPKVVGACHGALVAGANLVLLAMAVGGIILSPQGPPLIAVQVGDTLGWLSALTALVAVRVFLGPRAPGALLGLLVGALLAAGAVRWDRGQWLAYHVLLASWAVVAIFTLAVGWKRRADAPLSLPVQSWATVSAALVAVLSVRSVGLDPAGSWPGAMGLLVSATVAGALALATRRQAFVYASGLLLVGAEMALALGADVHRVNDWLAIGVTGLALSAALWSALESYLADREPPVRLRHGMPPYAHAGTVLAVAGLVVLAGCEVARWAVGLAMPAAGALQWTALVAVVVALSASYWDRENRFAAASFYATGLAGLGLVPGAVPGARLAIALPALAGYVSMAAVVFSFFKRRASKVSEAMAKDFGPLAYICSTDDNRPATMEKVAIEGSKNRLPSHSSGPMGVPFWFAAAQGVLGRVITAMGVWLCVARAGSVECLAAPLAMLLLLPAALLALKEAGHRRGWAQAAVLTIGAFAILELPWAWLDPAFPWPWLERSALLLAGCSGLTLAYGVGLPRWASGSSGWAERGRMVALVLGAIALLLVGAVLAQETALTLTGRGLHLGAVALGLAAGAMGLLALAGIAFAVRKDLDPLGLPDVRRTAYVYLSELLVVALFVHLRLAAPEWFTGRFAEHWAFVLMGLAFAGALASEALARAGLAVLAGPVGRTGVVLPVVPMLAFWLRPGGEWSAVWFAVGLFYALVSVMHRSLGFALLAALAANGGLWAILHENQIAFIHHPQVWLVPLALTVLVAGHLNRDRLGRRQLAGLRYGALSVLYLASTAETFLAGLGHDAWRPVLLVVLSVGGVFAGMLLRVRAFLFLGALFVSLGVLALVWHAAQSQAWLWYVSGIALGAAIIVLFAIFEKRREEVLHLLERLREWE